MCGIYGVIGRPRRPEAGLNAIRRRGPDQVGVWRDDTHGVWLGHRRLSIIDLSDAGAQPMVSPDGRYAMIYNGEIYNYRELRVELERVGEIFRGHSDSEVLLRLFCRRGTDAFTALNGIFAAAFWDRHERRLTLVRDPMGVKPLYYTQGGDSFAFASEIKALVRAGDVVARVDPPSVLRHLGLLWSPGTQTIVAGVHKLLPGEVVERSVEGSIAKWTYSDPALPVVEKPPLTERAAIARVAGAVEAAVARQLVSDVPLGAFLSGGLDSSAIVAMAARHLPTGTPLQCFSIDLLTDALGGEGFVDDLPYARRIADHLGVDLQVVRADTSMLERLQEMIYFLDEPTADLAALNSLLISELGRSQSMKILLSGAGGDDIFTGYRRHFALTQERKWAWLPPFARSALASGTAQLPRNIPLARRIAKAFENAAADADSRLAGYFNWLPAADAMKLMAPELLSGLDAHTLAAPLHETLRRVPAGASQLEKLLYLECRHFLVDHNLNYADKMGMAAGVEVRVPLIDLELVREAMLIPEHMKQRGRTGKWIFKRAMEPYLPHDVIYRPKTGFGVPLRSWIVGPLDPMIRDVLSERSLRDRGIFSPQSVAELIDQTRIGRRDGAYTIFALLCIELWCRQYVDGDYAIDADLEKNYVSGSLN